MKTTFRYDSLNADAPWPPLVTQQIEHLQSLTAITSSEIVLEHQRESNPSFRVQMRLDIAGSDLHAKASDNTLEAALSKATQDLSDQIQTRKTKPIALGEDTTQPSANSKRRPRGRTGPKA